MRKLFYYIAVVFLITGATATYAQSEATQAKKEEKPKIYYKIVGKYPLNVASVYKMTEKVDVKRILPDGSDKKYSRELTYFFTLVAPNAPVNGFITLTGTVDSLTYKFKDKDNDIDVVYNSQDEEAWPPLKYQDYEQNSVLLGKDFEMTYSPYGEVTQFGGEMLAEKRANLLDPSTGPDDSLRKFIWLNALSDDMLEYFFDIQKNLVPDVPATADTTWRAPFYWQTEGYRMRDTLDVKFEVASTREYVMKGVAKNLRLIPAPMHPYRIPMFLDPVSASGTGTYSLKMNPQGGVLGADADFNVTGSYQLGKDLVKEEIKTKVKWELLDMYRW